MFVPTSHRVDTSLSSDMSQLCRRFTLSEIQLATKNLDESLVIGRGGFGKVYKGTITNSSTISTVAIKRLDSTSNQGASEFWAEVNMLSNLRHCHLVSLIGYCNDGQEMILVYEFMSRGTLEDHLHKHQTSLPWVKRLAICVGAARGLDYLHTGTGNEHGVVHRDVKSSNILLHDSWAAKVSDFGLSRICPKNQQTTYINTGVKGTFGYLDPDYFTTGKVTRKSDVYAFGVVLLEVLCGKRAVDRSIDEEQWGLAVWAQNSIKEGRLKEIVDTNIRGSISPKCLKAFAQLAKRCLHMHPKQRPTMAEVVVGLRSILALQEKANNTLQPSNMILFGRKIAEVILPLKDENSGWACSLPNWDKRYKILLGVARALLYLHRDAPIRIIHGDVKPGNILLDENLNPILSGFLNIRYLDINETDCYLATNSLPWRYMAPEYMCYSNVSTKADVYSFGVLVLESIIKHSSSSYSFLLKYFQINRLEGTLSNIIDPSIDTDSSSMTRFLEIGLLCTKKDAEDRPTMEEVVSMLLDSSSLTLRVEKVREMNTTECPNSTIVPADNYDVDRTTDYSSQSTDGALTIVRTTDHIKQLIF